MSSKTSIKARQSPPEKRPPGRPTLSNEQLLDQALELFLKNGFERTSIEAIAARAGVAKRTVYLRYGNKESLFKASLKRAIEEWIVPVEELRSHETDDLAETLLRLGRRLVSNIMTPAGIKLLRITNAESGRRPEIGAFTYQHGTQRTIAYLADLFQRRLGAPPSGQTDWTEAAIAFLYLVVSGPPTMLAWGLKLDLAAVDNHTEYCVRLFLNGVAPRAALTKAAIDKAADLELENQRLRNLLVAAMLDVAAAKEASQSNN